MGLKISYAITVKNELEEIQRLLNVLRKHKREEDEIIILFDSLNGSKEVLDYVHSLEGIEEDDYGSIFVLKRDFNKDFAEHKNYLNSLCSPSHDYVFQIDADEYPHENLIKNLPSILEANEGIFDLLWVPRINTVDGITQEHINKWGWRVNEKGWVNWENDYQGRIYKNFPGIKWVGKVHEKIKGHKSYTHLPLDENFALYHPKTIKKQEQQNELYNTL